MVAVPLTTHRAPRRIYRGQVLVLPDSGNGLDSPSVVMCEQVRCLDKKRLGRRRGELSAHDLSRVEEALANVLVL